MSDDPLNPHVFGDPFTNQDALEFIASPQANLGDAVPGAAPYYCGRWKALVCAFRIAGSFMDEATREALSERLGECHVLAKRLTPPLEPDVEEAGSYFFLLAASVLTRSTLGK